MNTEKIRAGMTIPDDAIGNCTECRRLYDLQRAAFTAFPFPDYRTRLGCLERLAGTLARHSPRIAAAISADFGIRSRHETYLLELVPVCNAIRHARENLARWMRPERRRVAWTFKPGKAWVQYRPLGVVGIISPWNYPLSLALLPLVDALAAGNRILLKPPELTPVFSILLKELLGEAFSEEEVGVILGGPEVSAQFTRLPLDHLFFTGSTAVGRKIMGAAAENLTPVTLELGGKSPVVLCPDYDAGAAARDITYGKLANAGQTCIAPDYALAPKEKARVFAEAVIAQARRHYPSITLNPDYTSILSDHHYRRLKDAIEEARAGGAEILSHGDRPADGSRRIEPTVVLNPPDECVLMREEIFGPVLPVIEYEKLDDAIAYTNARERPLALYCLTHDRSYRNQVLSRTISGGVTVNGTLLHNAQEDLPFGGVGSSGIGFYHGFAGFRRFSHGRSVYQVRMVNVLRYLSPPYGRVVRLAIWVLGGRSAAEDC